MEKQLGGILGHVLADGLKVVCPTMEGAWERIGRADVGDKKQIPSIPNRPSIEVVQILQGEPCPEWCHLFFTHPTTLEASGHRI